MSDQKSVPSNESLEKAVNDLKKAEDHLAHARAEEAEAEREIVDAMREIDEAEHHGHEVTAHVLHVNEAERATFKEPILATLQQVWDQAYDELKIERNSKDVFQTGGERPVSLMNHLALTLDQAKEQHVIHNCQFSIVSETGGA